jgi:hypothetical protein
MLLIAVFSKSYSAYAQVQWTETLGAEASIDPNDMYITDMQTDSKNNVYVLGTNSMRAGNLISFNNQYMTRLQSGIRGTALFLVKYNPAGHLLWTKSLVNEMDGKIAIDAFDNIYVSAQFYQKVAIDADTIITTGYGMYLAKFSEEGKLLWVKTGESTGASLLNEMICDKNNDIILSGTYAGSGMVWQGRRISSGASPAIYVMKINENGSVLWLRNIDFIQYGWTVMGQPVKLLEGPDGNIYGLFAEGGRNWFSSCEYNYWHMILVCMHPDGELAWEKDFACTDLMAVSDMDVNSFGELMVVGCFRGKFQFGNASITSASDDHSIQCHVMEAFLARFDKDGNVLAATNIPAGKFSSDYFQIKCESDGGYIISGMRHYAVSTGYPGYHSGFPDGRDRYFFSQFDAMGKTLKTNEFYKYTNISWPDYYFGTNPKLCIDHEGNYIIGDDDRSQYDTLPGCIKNENQNILIYKLNKDLVQKPVVSDPKIYLWPNPASDFLTAEISDSAYLQYTCSVTDISGQELLHFNKTDPGTDVFRMDISPLPAGMYLLGFRNDKESRVIKFIKYQR